MKVRNYGILILICVYFVEKCRCGSCIYNFNGYDYNGVYIDNIWWRSFNNFVIRKSDNFFYRRSSYIIYYNRWRRYIIYIWFGKYNIFIKWRIFVFFGLRIDIIYVCFSD